MFGGVEAFFFSFELENDVEALMGAKTRREGRETVVMSGCDRIRW